MIPSLRIRYFMSLDKIHKTDSIWLAKNAKNSMLVKLQTCFKKYKRPSFFDIRTIKSEVYTFSQVCYSFKLSWPFYSFMFKDNNYNNMKTLCKNILNFLSPWFKGQHNVQLITSLTFTMYTYSIYIQLIFLEIISF